MPTHRPYDSPIICQLNYRDLFEVVPSGWKVSPLCQDNLWCLEDQSMWTCGQQCFIKYWFITPLKVKHILTRSYHTTKHLHSTTIVLNHVRSWPVYVLEWIVQEVSLQGKMFLFSRCFVVCYLYSSYMRLTISVIVRCSCDVWMLSNLNFFIMMLWQNPMHCQTWICR